MIYIENTAWWIYCTHHDLMSQLFDGSSFPVLHSHQQQQSPHLELTKPITWSSGYRLVLLHSQADAVLHVTYNFSLQAYLEMFHPWQPKSPGWCPFQRNELWQSVMFWKICTTSEYVQKDKVAFTVQNKPSTCTKAVCLHCLPWSAAVPHGANREHVGKPDNLCYATVEAKANLTLSFISPTSNCWVIWMLTSKANTVNNC